MPQYVQIATATIPAGQNVPLLDAIPCRKGLVTHRTGSGTVTLHAARNVNKTSYMVEFTGNLAVADGGTVGPVSLALTLDGEPVYSGTRTVTPAATGDFFNVHMTAPVDIINTPCAAGCCVAIGVQNISGTPVDVANGELTVTRTA